MKNENESFRRGSFFVFDRGDLIGVLASKLARAVYYILKRERIFDMKKFLTN